MPPEVTHEVIPEVPQKSLSTIHGTLRVAVRVKVDESGNVSDATFDSPGPSEYFSKIAMKAARQWTFSPTASSGQSVPSEWVLHFRFTNAAAKVQPVRASPTN